MWRTGNKKGMRHQDGEAALCELFSGKNKESVKSAHFFHMMSI